MCGIAGVVDPRGHGADAAARLRTCAQAMIDVVPYRGPDGQGVAVELDGALALAHRRLSIYDLSARAAQPMVRSDRWVITFNGAVYNYEAIRTELEQLGHAFVTSGDTEVILAAYAQWGTDCVRRFNGMWAFAILDRRDRTLFLCRDRFGVKPLFLRWDGGRLLFASEIKQILAVAPVARPQLARVEDFVVHGMIDHADTTFFEGITRLEPGTWLRVNVDDLTSAAGRFHAMRPCPDTARMSPEDAGRHYLALLEDAVRLRMSADVPVGTCLSGGLDSSTVALMAARHLGSLRADATFSAVTAAAEDPSLDESDWARQVVERAGLDWQVTRPTGADFVASLDTIVAAQDEPFTTPSITMQYFVMKAAAARGLKVMLDGQGGDETLLGYSRYVAVLLRQVWRDEGLAAARRTLAAIRENNPEVTPAGLARFAAMTWLPGLRLRHNRRRAGLPAGGPRGALAPLEDHAECATDVTAVRIAQLHHQNLPPLLRYEDRNAMQHSVETRLPFLDWRLVDVALALPLTALSGDGWSKPLLRRYIADAGVPDVAWRRRKQGFDAPERLWLGGLAPRMRAEAAGSRLLREFYGERGLARALAGAETTLLWRLWQLARWEALRLS